MWEVPARRLLREKIGDTTTPYAYENCRLDEINLVAAAEVANTISFDRTYVVNLTTSTISPDPATHGDYDFLNLIVLRATSMILFSEFRTASAQGFMFKDASSSLDTRASLDAKKALWQDADKNFAKAKMSYQAGDRTSGHGIVGPYSFQEVNYHVYR